MSGFTAIMVLTAVGCTVLTRMLIGASALASVRISPTMPCFGRRVTQTAALQPAESLDACGRTGENDDTTAVSGEQMRNRRPGGVVRAVEVDAGDRLPLGQLFFDAQLSKRQRRDARIGQDDVEPPEMFDAGIDGGLDLIEIAHVGNRCRASCRRPPRRVRRSRRVHPARPSDIRWRRCRRRCRCR